MTPLALIILLLLVAAFVLLLVQAWLDRSLGFLALALGVLAYLLTNLPG